MTKQMISSFTNSSVPPLSATKEEVGRQLGGSDTIEVMPCNASDLQQQWDLVSNESQTTIRSRADNLCLDSRGLALAACDAGASQQQWDLTPPPSMNIAVADQRHSCLDVYNFSGPSISLSRGCKKPNEGARGSQNEQFAFDANSGLLHSLATQACCGSPSRPILGPLCVGRAPSPPPPPPPAMVNIPMCLASAPNEHPPLPPTAPPAVDPTLPLQLWAGPLTDNALVVAMLNADSSGT